MKWSGQIKSLLFLWFMRRNFNVNLLLFVLNYISKAYRYKINLMLKRLKIINIFYIFTVIKIPNTGYQFF